MPSLPYDKEFLQCFWDLASVDGTLRSKAAAILVSYVTKRKPETTDDDDKGTASTWDELDYSLKRLIRGLSSSREGARQGFATALTELLRTFTNIDLTQVLFLVNQHLSTSGKKKQEERDSLFGKFFALLSMIRSERLMLSFEKGEVEAMTVAHNITMELFSLVFKKGYMREICTKAFDVLLGQLVQFNRQQILLGHKSLLQYLSVNVLSADHLAMILVLQKHIPEIKLDQFVPNWPGRKLLKKKTLSTFLDALSFTVISLPNIHVVWELLFEAMLRPSNGEVDSSLFQFLWVSAVDGPLIASDNPNKRFLGLKLVELVFTKFFHYESINCIFTRSLTRLFTGPLKQKGDPLHKPAKHLLTVLSKVGDENPEARTALLLGLTGENGSVFFDQNTNTKTIEGLISKLDPAVLDQFFQRLNDRLYGVIHREARSLEEKQELIRRTEFSRNLYMSNLLSFVRSSSYPKTEAWIQKVVKVSFFHAFFVFEEPTDSSESSAKPKKGAKTPVVSEEDKALLFRPLSVPFSLKTASAFRERFFSIISEVAAMILDEEKTEDTHKDRKLEGVMKSGTQWLHYVFFDLVNEFEKVPGVSLRKPFTADQKQGFEVTKKLITRINTEIKKKTNASNPQKLNTLHFYSVLVLNVGTILLLQDATEALQILSDLERCAEDIFFPKKVTRSSAKPVPKPKAKKADDSDDDDDDDDDDEDGEEPSPYSILVDIMISLLSQSSQHLRSIVKSVFRSIAPDLPVEALKPILEALVIDPEDLLQEVDEDDDMVPFDHDSDDSDDDDSDDDSEEEEEEDDDDEQKKEEKSKKLEKDKEAEAKKKAFMEEMIDVEAEDRSTLERFDEQVSALLKLRKEEKTKKFTTAQTAQHLKSKLIDLLQIYIQRRSDYVGIIAYLIELFLKTKRSERKQQLHKRIGTLILDTLCKTHRFPSKDLIDTDKIASSLTSIFTIIQKSFIEPYDFQVMSELLFFILKLLKHGEEDGGYGLWPLDLINTNFKIIVTNFLSKSSTKIGPKFFESLLKRFPLFAAQHIAPLLVEAITSESDSKVRNDFLRVQVFELLNKIVENKASAAANQVFLETNGPKIFEAFGQIVDTELATIKIDRIVELLRIVSKFVALYKSFSAPDSDFYTTLKPLILEHTNKILSSRPTKRVISLCHNVLNHFNAPKPVKKRARDNKATDVDAEAAAPPAKKAKKSKKDVVQEDDEIKVETNGAAMSDDEDSDADREDTPAEAKDKKDKKAAKKEKWEKKKQEKKKEKKEKKKSSKAEKPLKKEKDLSDDDVEADDNDTEDQEKPAKKDKKKKKKSSKKQ